MDGLWNFWRPQAYGLDGEISSPSPTGLSALLSLARNLSPFPARPARATRQSCSQGLTRAPGRFFSRPFCLAERTSPISVRFLSLCPLICPAL
eukprot:m.484429 g.484429  ORF g.484429 m.484429 type:complete len:93 (+) comp57201_c0_seq2:1323-1601(+)